MFNFFNNGGADTFSDSYLCNINAYVVYCTLVAFHIADSRRGNTSAYLRDRSASLIVRDCIQHIEVK